MSKKQIVLTMTVMVDEDEANNGELYHHLECEDMTLLMRDALGEFCKARGWTPDENMTGILAYVFERYPSLSLTRRMDKEAEVFNRCWIANTLKKADVHIEVK